MTDTAPTSRLRRLLVALLVIPGAGAAAASLVGLLGALWWVFDLAAHFRPQYAVVLIVVGVLLLALRAPAVALSLLLVGAVDGAILAPYWLGSSPGIAAGAPTITVMSFNVGVSNPDRSGVVEMIRTEDPDVVFIWESSFEWEDAVAAGDLPHLLVAIVPRSRLAGVTVLAKPEVRPGLVETGLRGEVAAITVRLGAGEIEILGVHPPSPISGERSERRDELLTDAGRWVAGRSVPVLVVGDLNATPWSQGFRALQRSGQLSDTLHGSGLQATWPSGAGPLMIPIDHALHTAGLGTTDRRTGPSVGSAHRPLLITVGPAA